MCWRKIHTPIRARLWNSALTLFLTALVQRSVPAVAPMVDTGVMVSQHLVPLGKRGQGNSALDPELYHHWSSPTSPVSRHSLIRYPFCVQAKFAPVAGGNYQHIISVINAVDVLGGLLLVQNIGTGHNARPVKQSPQGKSFSPHQNLHVRSYSMQSGTIKP